VLVAAMSECSMLATLARCCCVREAGTNRMPPSPDHLRSRARLWLWLPREPTRAREMGSWVSSSKDQIDMAC